MSARARCWIWARIKINVAQIWASSALSGLFMADIGPSFGLPVAQIWQTGADRPSAIFFTVCGPEQGVGYGPELKSMWPRFGLVLLFLVYSWLKLGLLLAYLWSTFGKQERTAQVPSFFTVCGPEQGVGSGPELKSMWPRFGLVLLYLVYSWLTLGLPLAYLWPKSGKQERTAQVPSFHAVCGPDESVRCGPDLGLRNFAIWVTCLKVNAHQGELSLAGDVIAIEQC